jgi:hypothetical protein
MAAYVRLMRKGVPFAFPGYSDAEWFCMTGMREGGLTGAGQLLSAEHGQLLTDILVRRQRDPLFFPAVPGCLTRLPAFCDGLVERFLDARGVDLVAHERDAVLDDLARAAGLYPFIRQLREMGPVLVGPEALRPFAPELGARAFVPVSTPNLHHEPGGIGRAADAVEDALAGRPGVVLVSAGVSAAVLVDKVWDFSDGGVWAIDCGSVWDGFVGIGAQRQWRADLYADPARWERWRRKNLEGV